MKKKKNIFIILLIALILTMPGPEEIDVLSKKMQKPLVIVVDAGHGGPDGGAEAADGTLEKDLNLSIAKAIKKEGQRCGIEVILTRTSTEGLYAEDNLEKKWRKLDDMQQRKRIIEETEPDAVISVHMNCFWSDVRVRGAQVLYPGQGEEKVLAESQELAKNLQKQLIAELADGSNRIQMEKNGVYILENPTVPTVLVECGFLSNSEDLANLKQKQWQEEIAKAIITGVRKTMEI